ISPLISKTKTVLFTGSGSADWAKRFVGRITNHKSIKMTQCFISQVYALIYIISVANESRYATYLLEIKIFRVLDQYFVVKSFTLSRRLPQITIKLFLKK